MLKELVDRFKHLDLLDCIALIALAFGVYRFVDNMRHITW